MSHLRDDEIQSLAESGATDAHLGSCDVCRREIAAYRRLAARLAHLEGPEPPADFVAAVMRRIDAAPPLPLAAMMALLLAACGSLAGLIALLPDRTVLWPSVHGFVLFARILRGTLLSYSGAPLCATALLVLFAAASIRQLLKENRT